MKYHCLALALGLTILGLSNVSSAAPGFRVQNTVPEEATFTLGKPGRFGPTVIPAPLLKQFIARMLCILVIPEPCSLWARFRAARLSFAGGSPKPPFKHFERPVEKRFDSTSRIVMETQSATTGWIDQKARMRKDVVLKQGPRIRPQVEGIPKEKTEAELLYRGLNRYISSVVHCATRLKNIVGKPVSRN